MTDELGELLATDPGAARCYAFVTGQESSLDALRACYGDETAKPETPEQTLARIVGVTDAQARRAMNEPSPVTADPAHDDAEIERVWQAWAERIGVAEPAADADADVDEWRVW
jgi:hypothetical protein